MGRDRKINRIIGNRSAIPYGPAVLATAVSVSILAWVGCGDEAKDCQSDPNACGGHSECADTGGGVWVCVPWNESDGGLGRPQRLPEGDIFELLIHEDPICGGLYAPLPRALSGDDTLIISAGCENTAVEAKFDALKGPGDRARCLSYTSGTGPTEIACGRSAVGQVALRLESSGLRVSGECGCASASAIRFDLPLESDEEPAEGDAP